MKRKLAVSLAAVVFLLCGAMMVGAGTVNVTEIGSAGEGPGNVLEASYVDGEDASEPKVWGQLSTTQDGVTVADSAWAKDGNTITGTYGSPSADTVWEINVHWRLRGHVSVGSYVSPPTGITTHYMMAMDVIAELRAPNPNISMPGAFTQDDPKQAFFQNEQFYDQKDSMVEAYESILNQGTVEFRYDLWLDVVGEISRGEMYIWCRGEPLSGSDPTIPWNAGNIRLRNQQTGEILVETVLYQ